MKIGKWVRMGLAAAPLLIAGCKGFFTTPPTTTTTTSGTSGVFYTLNQKASQIAAFSIVSGKITAVTNGVYTLASVPFAIAISPNSSYLYVSTAAGIYIYAIGTGGVLTIGNGGSVISQDPAYTMQVDPSNNWLIEAISGDGTLNAIPIVASSGLLDSTNTEQTVALPATTVQQLVVSPADSTTPFVFVALGSGGTAIVQFTTGNTDPFGTVSHIAVKNTAGAANTIGIDPSNRLLYVGETVATTGTQTGGVRVFTVGTTITEVSGSPYTTAGTGPSAILPTADYVYVANKAVSGSTDGNITGYAITATGSVYSLSSVNSVTTGISTVGLAEDSTSTYVLAVSSGGTPDLDAFTFDTTTPGKLDASTSATTGTDPTESVAIAAIP